MVLQTRLRRNRSAKQDQSTSGELAAEKQCSQSAEFSGICRTEGDVTRALNFSGIPYGDRTRLGGDEAGRAKGRRTRSLFLNQRGHS